MTKKQKQSVYLNTAPTSHKNTTKDEAAKQLQITVFKFVWIAVFLVISVVIFILPNIPFFVQLVLWIVLIVAMKGCEKDIVQMIKSGNFLATFPTKLESKWRPNPDEYKNLEQVEEALRKRGLESCNLAIAIDYTKSNEWQGWKSFGAKNLHYISEDINEMNPYEQVIRIIYRTLERYDDDKLIPVIGFGDINTGDRSVVSLKANNQPCTGLDDVLYSYAEFSRKVTMSGPTNLAPTIEYAINIVKRTGQYHILLIITDGNVDKVQETREAVIKASNYPISIVIVGVGDGPFDEMELLDDGLSERRFDNLQFVEWNKIIDGKKHPDAAFAVTALQEIPAQLAAIKELQLL